MIGLVLVAMLGASSTPSVPALSRKLSCAEPIDYKNQPSGQPIMIRWRSGDRGRRVENLWLFADGELTFTVQVVELGSVGCRARLTPERVAVFKSQLARTEFWRVRVAKTVSGPEVEALFLHLEVGECDFKMTPARWKQSSAAMAIQASIDALMFDVCAGACPEPKERSRSGPAEDRPDTIPIGRPPDRTPLPKKR